MNFDLIPQDKGVRQYQLHEVREHSRKPDEIRDLIASMYSGPRIELFARKQFEGWHAWGNETDKFEGKDDEA